MYFKYILFLFVLAIGVSSCDLADDLKKIQDNKVTLADHSYKVAVPLVNTRLTIQDLLEVSEADSSEFLNIGEDGFITLVYSQAIEIPAFAGLDQIEIPDVNVPGISMNVEFDMPSIPDTSVDAGAITLRSLVGDEAADALNLIGEVGVTIEDSLRVAQATTDIDTTISVPYGHVCLGDTTVQIPDATNPPTFLKDTTITMCTEDTTGWGILGITMEGDGTIPCGSDDYPCTDTVRYEDTTVTLAYIIDEGLAPTEVTDVLNDSQDSVVVYIELDTTIPPLEAQTIEAMDPDTIAVPLTGVNFITLGSGSISMTVENKLPVALQNMAFEVRSLTANGSIELGTMNFVSVDSDETEVQTIDLTGADLYGDITFQMMGLSTPEYSGPINADSSFRIAVDVADLSVSAVTALTDELVSAEIEGFESTTLIEDSIVQSFDLGADLSVSEVVLDSGLFSYAVSSAFRTDVDIIMSIPRLRDDQGQAFQNTIELDYTGSIPIVNEASIDLSNYTLTLMEGDDTTAGVNVYYSAVLAGDTILLADNISFSFSAGISGLKLNEARGNFGQMELPAIDSSIDIGIYNSQTSGKIIFSEPSVAVAFENSFGLPVGINFNMVGYNAITGDSVAIGDFTADNLVIDAPEVAGVSVRDTFIVDETNGLDDLFGLPPNGIELSLGVITNPNGDASTVNFITDSSAISASVDVQIPFVARIENFEIRDTLPFNYLDDSTKEQAQGKNSALTLSVLIENEFPIGVGLQIEFFDTNGVKLGQLIDSNAVADTLIEAGQVDDNGVVIAPSTRVVSLTLDGAKAEMVTQTTEIVVIGKLRTPGGDAGENIRFLSTYGFGIKMGIIAAAQTDDFIQDILDQLFEEDQ